MIDIIFENRDLKFTKLSASAFNDSNLFYDDEAGTVTFLGYEFKVNEPIWVYRYLKEQERFTDPKTRVLVEIRMAPTGQVFARRQYYKSAAAYRFDKLMERHIPSMESYGFVNRRKDELYEDFCEYMDHNLGYRVR